MVLIIEHDPDLLDCYKNIVIEAGFAVQTVPTLDLAIDLLAVDTRCQCIVSDFYFEEGRRRLTELFDQQRPLPCVTISSEPLPRGLPLFLTEFALRKPPDFNVLVRFINQAVNSHRPSSG